ncbi:hypothetical protein CDES_09490 [Corynebacterium deserti GIMN1.010]|uniref:YbjN domain-containing protein n=1 Tax=Corynebacterium deserti GIMN1.010 TaxID=931089 RepID=A0A0M5IRB5_9CORY|nr:YbjN domain-containing protein [Corynebacterium deserti]ALC06286.1 hypothetical protein CDES_09490 [Corynebacterium deserti GIMN1.010]
MSTDPQGCALHKKGDRGELNLTVLPHDHLLQEGLDNSPVDDRNFPTHNATVPLPVDLHRVKNSVDDLGYHYLDSDDRLVIPWSSHRVSVYFAQESGNVLTVFGRMRLQLDMHSISDIARVITQWNAERIGPTALIHLTDDAMVEVQFRTSMSVEEGLNALQLERFLQMALDTTSMGVSFVIEHFSELLVPDSYGEEFTDEQDFDDLVEEISGIVIPVVAAPPSTLHPEWDEDEDEDEDDLEAIFGPLDESFDTKDSEDTDDDSDLYEGREFEEDESPMIPHAVTTERILEQLHAIGVHKTSGEDDFLLAWINEILLSFFVENGPTLLIKGHWDANMHPEKDFVKLFLICNQWNENSLTTKAFCHSDEAGLQVRVEFSVTTVEGLNDVQLRHNIALAIHHILQAVDSISTEATGSSAVDWPEHGA